MTTGPAPELARAVALHRARRFDEAERIYAALLAARPDDPQLLWMIGLCRLLKIRARYISGYLATKAASATHAWVAVIMHGHGWRSLVRRITVGLVKLTSRTGMAVATTTCRSSATNIVEGRITRWKLKSKSHRWIDGCFYLP